MADVTNIAGRINSISQEGVAVLASQTLDERKNEKQSVVNQETDEELANHGQRIGTLEQEVGSGGSVDERIAQAKSESESDIKGGASSDYDTLKKAEDAIKAEAAARQEADSSLDGRMRTLEDNSVRYTPQTPSQTEQAHARTNLDTYSKAEVNQIASAFTEQNYVSVQAVAATTAADIPTLINATGDGEQTDTLYSVGWFDGTAFDVTKYSLYTWNGTAYVQMAVCSSIGEVFDISVYNQSGGTPAQYETLALALGTDGANVPSGVRQGGMSVKFIQSNDNKYVQYRLMSETFNTTVANWQGVDDEPTNGSDNLVKSNGIYQINNQLSNIITNETNRATEAETQLGNIITNENNRALTEEARIEGRLDTNRFGYNVTVFGLVTGVHTLATAVKNVPSTERFGGQKITFKTDSGWVTYQNTSLDISDYEDVTNWVIDSGVTELGDVTITNNPDYEDLTQNEGGQLKFADKEYNAATYSGLGRVYLRKNIIEGVNTLTQSMLADDNTIYIIQYDYELAKDITIPDNCVLEFDGGSISGNKTLIGNGTGVRAELVKIFNTDISLAGTWNIKEAFLEWYGAKGDGTTDDTNALSKTLNNLGSVYLSPDRVYCVKNELSITGSFTIYGAGFNSILRLSDDGKIVCDDVLEHTIDIHNVRIENYLLHGYALFFEKNGGGTGGNPHSSMIINNVYFYHHNNWNNSLDSTTLYLHGVRESAICDCIFQGDGTYGTSIELEGNEPNNSITYNTANITIANCSFNWANKFIYSHAVKGSAPYMDGLRILNCSFMGSEYAIDVAFNDTIYIVNCMIDYNDHPIKIHNSGGIKIDGNYIQSKKDNVSLIDITYNVDISLYRDGDRITNNFLYAGVGAIQEHKIGISIVNSSPNTSSRNAYFNIFGNNLKMLGTAIRLTKAYQVYIGANTCSYCKSFLTVSNTNNTLLEGNRVAAEVGSFISGSNAGNTIIDETNFWGSKKAIVNQRIKFTGDGSVKKFGYNFYSRLIKVPESTCYITIEVPYGQTFDSALGTYSVKREIDPTNNLAQYLVYFEAAPSNGTVFYINFHLEYCGSVEIAVNNSGTFANKPSSDIYIGFKYHCTSGASIDGGVTESPNINIYYKGNNVWQDSSNNEVVAYRP